MGSMTLLLGGARSGKSRHAQQWAEARGGNVLFVATAQAFDDEMRVRIANHQQERPDGWTTLEAPLDVGAAVDGALRETPTPYGTVVLDCMTLLASNILLAQREDASVREITDALLVEVDAILAACHTHNADWLIVSNEVGMGVVPATRMGRDYRDALGAANQRLAAEADEVLLFVAGLSWRP
jgi:adenosylcobinamide kinase/adenosylcobinamide-phosphate guanylyltransferase